MSDTLFVVQIFASVIALMASYAFLMSILKREHNTLWLRGEAVLMLLMTGVSLSLYYTNLLNTNNYFAFAASLMLLLALLNALILVVTHRIKMRHDRAIYPEELVPGAKIVGYAAFAAITAHLFLQIAALAWG